MLPETIDFERMVLSLKAAAQQLCSQKDYFNDLDAPIGDSDHGDSIEFTFKQVLASLESCDTSQRDIGALLKVIGRRIVLSGGAAMGPLYGSGFVEAGNVVGTTTEIGAEELVAMMRGFVAGIERRGGVQLGEKTMFDTVVPAVEALAAAVASGEPLATAIDRARAAAVSGMRSTEEMHAKRGRSSRLGNRSVGHMDPGSASMCVFLSTLFESFVT